MARTIALLTDFRVSDPYVGQMKAVIESLAPKTQVIDVSHGVEPFNIIQGGYFLACSWPFFPRGTVFTAVVDPGVGTDRRVILAEKKDRLFLAPDNGLLGLVLQDGPAHLYDLSRAASKYEAHATFHGRDVFAPLAARLASGTMPHELGRGLEKDQLVREDWSSPVREGDGVKATVLHIDRFGNCVLNLAIDEWSETILGWGEARLHVPVSACLKVVRTYADLPLGEAGILAGSQGYFELAFNRTSASKNLGLNIGDSIQLNPCDAG